MGDTDLRTQVREFPTFRGERITPEQAGPPAYGGGNRRVEGLRLDIDTAEAGPPTVDGRSLLATRAATRSAELARTEE